MGGRTTRQLLRNTALYDLVFSFRQRRLVKQWERHGRVGSPPHAIKQRAVRHYAAKYGLRTMIETGTYLGDMVHGVRREFDRIYSIELDDRLWELASARFKRRGSVTVLKGDSAEELPKLVPGLDHPCLFWLDGHYSGGATAGVNANSPILTELSCVLQAPVPGHVILVDDARLFGTLGYPALDSVESLLGTARPDWCFEILDDIIRFSPEGA